MRVWRRINKVPGVPDRVAVTDIDENLKARYYTRRDDGTEKEWRTIDMSKTWESIEEFLSGVEDDFKEVTNDGLQRIFEVEGSNSSTKRV